MAEEVTDILWDATTDDLQIENGDFAIGVSSDQHIIDLLYSEAGDWKENPLIGIGIMRYINAPDTFRERSQLEKKIRKQLALDGFTIYQLTIDAPDDMVIDASITIE